MSKKSLINKLLERFGEPADTPPEEIDREVTAAVESIKAEKVETLEGEKVLSGSDSQSGGKVYIFDLQPIFGIIGGSEGRLADNLRKSCRKEFAELSVRGRDQATLEGDLFVMRFAGISDQENFILAANIVNTIGKDLLGSRFETLEVPDLLVVTSAANAFNPDGSPNLEAMRAAVEDGGFPVSMEKPDDDAPHWVKLRWKKEMQNFEISSQELQAKSEAIRGSTHDPSEWVKRKTESRRERAMRFEGKDKRKAFDRRGRGH